MVKRFWIAWLTVAAMLLTAACSGGEESSSAASGPDETPESSAAASSEGQEDSSPQQEESEPERDSLPASSEAAESRFRLVSGDLYDSAVPAAGELTQADDAAVEEIRRALDSFTVEGLDLMLCNEAHMPAGTTIAISDSEAQALLEELRQMQLMPAEVNPDKLNPSTGGGYFIYLKDGDLTLEAADAAFFTMTLNGTRYLFEWEDTAWSQRLGELIYEGSDSGAAAARIVTASELPVRVSSSHFATQAEFAQYQTAIAGLYAKDVEQMYYTPAHYDLESQPMTQAQVDAILSLLRATGQMEVFAQPENPPTGGIDQFCLQWQGGYLAGILNGDQLTVQLPGQTEGIILRYTGSTGLDGAVGQLQREVTYMGQPVNRMAAVDVKGGRAAWDAVDFNTVNYLQSYAEDHPDQAADNTAEYAYLLFTADGEKHYVYLKDAEAYGLADRCETVLLAQENHPHWLVHMGKDKIQKITFTGLDAQLTPDSSYQLVLEKGQDDASIAKIATMLRSVVVTTPAKIVDGRVNPDMPSGLFTIEIDFTTGVHYQIIGYSPGDNSFSIYTSDLDESMLYTAEGESVTALRQRIDNQR